MKRLAHILIGLGLLVAAPSGIAAEVTGVRWLHAVSAAGWAVTFTGWVLVARAGRRGGAR